MSKLSFIIVIALANFLAGGAIFLATWDISPPTKSVVKLIPHDRFTK